MIKNYAIYYNANTGKLFTHRYLIFVGIVQANNKVEALKKAQRHEFESVEVDLSRFDRNYPFIVNTNTSF